MATWGAGKTRGIGRGKALASVANIESRILLVRGLRVMLSSDLAGLYGVTVRALVQAVKRNHARFPADFMFQLTWEEASSRSQFVILKHGRNVKYRPYAFTEQGVAMLSSVLRSQRAIRVNVEIMRAFVQLRAAASVHHQLAEKLAELERVVGTHDQSIRAVFAALKQLMQPPYRKRRRIGFLASDRGRGNSRWGGV